MKKSIVKKLIIFAIFLTAVATNAQSNKQITPQKFTYYIDVKNVKTKTICLAVENNISQKNGVISFKTVGFPSKYFVLKTTKPINQSELNLWLQENNLESVYFGEGEKALEELLYKKIKK